METMMSQKATQQSIEYNFPYHYLAEENELGLCRFSKDWGYGASWLAAIKILQDELIKLKTKVKRNQLKILDVGSGDGAVTNQLSAWNKDCDFKGIDSDKNATRWANAFKKSDNVSFTTGNIKDFSVENMQTYDLVISIEVLEHIEPLRLTEFIGTIAKMIKEGGNIIVTVPHINSPMIDKHYQHFTINSLKDALDEHFECTQIYGFAQETLLSKLLMKVSINRKWCLKSDTVNRTIVNILRAKVSERKCKRLFYSGIKRQIKDD